MHHPLAALRWHDEDDVLSGAGDALTSWSQAGVNLVLGGHTHTPYTVPVRTVPGLHAGGSHSVNLLRRGAAGVWRIEQWDLQREVGLFARRDWREVGA